MRDTTTRDYQWDEEEATHWLEVFEALPDARFSNSEVKPRAFLLTKIKAFARAYQPMTILGKEAGVVIN